MINSITYTNVNLYLTKKPDESADVKCIHVNIRAYIRNALSCEERKKFSHTNGARAAHKLRVVGDETV